MKAGQRLWTRDELILAINLYCKTPFGRLHSRNPEIIQLAKLIGRTPNSIAYKLVNFASLDPSQKQRGIKGAANASKLDEKVWSEFYNNWDEAIIESERLLAELKNTTVEEMNAVEESLIVREGLERQQLVQVRVNQSIFRKMILAAYSGKCCITGIGNPELIIASHILPWSKDKGNRLNPMNGLALNALHDRAFENGLIAIDENYVIHISGRLKVGEDVINNMFGVYDGKQIALPKQFQPSKDFLKTRMENFLP